MNQTTNKTSFEAHLAKYKATRKDTAIEKETSSDSSPPKKNTEESVFLNDPTVDLEMSESDDSDEDQETILKTSEYVAARAKVLNIQINGMAVFYAKLLNAFTAQDLIKMHLILSDLNVCHWEIQNAIKLQSACITKFGKCDAIDVARASLLGIDTTPMHEDEDGFFWLLPSKDVKEHHQGKRKRKQVRFDNKKKKDQKKTEESLVKKRRKIKKKLFSS